MKFKHLMAGASAAALGVCLAAGVSAAQPASNTNATQTNGLTDYTMTRIAGSDRYVTSHDIAQTGWAAQYSDKAAVKHLVVTSGENFPDALSSSCLAGRGDVPILLVQKDSVGPVQEIIDSFYNVLMPIVVGGENSVSKNTLDEAFKNMAVPTAYIRLAGDNRELTSLKVLENFESWADKDTADSIIIAAGQNFADSLSISPYSCSKQVPIVLASSDKTLTQEAIEKIKGYNNIKNVIIVGGENSVSEQVKAQLGDSYSYTRLAGDDRYETSVKIASWELEHGMSAQNAAIATGKNFPDALSGSALSGKMNSVLMLVDEGHVSDAKNLLASKRADMNEKFNLYVYGGENSVSEATANEILKVESNNNSNDNSGTDSSDGSNSGDNSTTPADDNKKDDANTPGTSDNNSGSDSDASKGDSSNEGGSTDTPGTSDNNNSGNNDTTQSLSIDYGKDVTLEKAIFNVTEEVEYYDYSYGDLSLICTYTNNNSTAVNVKDVLGTNGTWRVMWLFSNSTTPRNVDFNGATAPEGYPSETGHVVGSTCGSDIIDDASTIQPGQSVKFWVTSEHIRSDSLDPCSDGTPSTITYEQTSTNGEDYGDPLCGYFLGDINYEELMENGTYEFNKSSDLGHTWQVVNTNLTTTKQVWNPDVSYIVHCFDCDDEDWVYSLESIQAHQVSHLTSGWDFEAPKPESYTLGYRAVDNGSFSASSETATTSDSICTVCGDIKIG